MVSFRSGRVARSRLCRTLCVCATWVHVAPAWAQAANGTAVTPATTVENVISSSLAVMASAQKNALYPSGTALIPSAPKPTVLIPSTFDDESFAAFKIPITGLIPSAPVSSRILPSEPAWDDPSLAAPPPTTSDIQLPSSTRSSRIGLIPSAHPSQQTLTTSGDIVSFPTLSVPFPSNGTNGTHVTSAIPGMTSTNEGLHPIPPPSTISGDPNGHHEIPEPGFSTTLPCRGCSPVIEISATGWETLPSIPAQEQETKAVSTPAVTVGAAPSNIIVKPGPSEGDFIIGDSTVKPGTPVTVGGSTPVVIQTSDGHTDVVIGGTQTVPLQPSNDAPAATITAGTSPIIVKPIPGNNFLIGSSTVTPGQTITISNTPIAVQTRDSTTEVVVGATQTIRLPPPDSTITDAPIPLPITLSDSGKVLTPIPGLNANNDQPANPQAYIIDNQTLAPGGPALIISSTTYSLAPSATELVINGATTTLSPSYGSIYTTVAAAPLTLWGHVYTANRAGYYALAPGTTLVPGGPAVTISDSVISLEPHGTAAIIQGRSSAMPPVTQIVTVPRSTGLTPGTRLAAPGPVSTEARHSGAVAGRDAWTNVDVVLGAFAVGWLGVWL